MQEIELKCQIPAAALAAVRAQLLATGSREAAGLVQHRLQARYFDTPTCQLAQARAALRLRREGDNWVQTLKAQARSPGATHLHRLEHNVQIACGPESGWQQMPCASGASGASGASDVPVLRLDRHLGTPAAEALAQALGLSLEAFQSGAEAGDTLGLLTRFETDIQRTQAVILRDGARIELALDEGEIRASGRSLTLSELELELCSGPVESLIREAQDWVSAHGLWVDVRSKAERGECLARAELLGVATPVKRPVLNPDESAAEALRQAVAAVLNPLLALGSVVADPALTARLTPEHVRYWHRGLALLHQTLAQAGEPALAGLSGPAPAGWSADWAEALLLLLAPLDAADPKESALWARAARSERHQRLILDLLGWLASAR